MKTNKLKVVETTVLLSVLGSLALPGTASAQRDPRHYKCKYRVHEAKTLPPGYARPRPPGPDGNRHRGPGGPGKHGKHGQGKHGHGEHGHSKHGHDRGPRGDDRGPRGDDRRGYGPR